MCNLDWDLMRPSHHIFMDETLAQCDYQVLMSFFRTDNLRSSKHRTLLAGTTQLQDYRKASFSHGTH